MLDEAKSWNLNFQTLSLSQRFSDFIIHEILQGIELLRGAPVYQFSGIELLARQNLFPSNCLQNDFRLKLLKNFFLTFYRIPFR